MSNRTGAKPKVGNEPRLYSVKTVKAMFDVPEFRTLTRWMASPAVGFPQAVWINGQRFFDADEVDAFVKNRVAESLRGVK